MASFKRISIFFVLALLVSASSAYAEGMNVIRDEEIETDLKIISKPIFEQAGLSSETVRFVMIDNPELNAFVAGGQNIFLHTGLILETQNPEELFGVIAHETGHIADGHLFRGQVEASNLSLPALLGNLIGIAVAIGTRSGEAGAAISNASSSLALRNMLRHTRTQEASADQAGIRFLRGAHLPATGFLSFMKKLSSQELLPESQQTQYILTHPLTQDRIDFLRHIVDTEKQGVVSPEWNEMHRRVKAKLTGYLFPDRVLQSAAVADGSVAARYSRAIAWFRKAQAGKAIGIIDALLKEEPKNPYFYELKGQILMENGHVEEAVSAYARAVELAPSSGLIRVTYAHSLLESKEKKAERRAEAIRQLTIAQDREKKMPELHRFLAVAYGAQGEEGLSRLQLAEEALLQGNKEFAEREAKIAKANLKKETPAYLRADDIINLLSKKPAKTEKNN